MAPVVSPSAPASSSKPKSKNRRSKSSAKKNLIAAQPQESSNVDQDLIPLSDVVMGESTADGDGQMEVDSENAPSFPALPASAQRATEKSESRKIPIPPHRMTPLKKDWVNIFSPLTEMLGLQVRMNVQKRAVEIRVSRI
jgi:RNA-binding protein PNO1